MKWKVIDKFLVHAIYCNATTFYMIYVLNPYYMTLSTEHTHTHTHFTHEQ